jgi:hypothetical protein
VPLKSAEDLGADRERSFELDRQRLRAPRLNAGIVS